MLRIYTDGSSTTKRSGWAFVVTTDNMLIDYVYGASKDYTNQEMELTAAIEACKWYGYSEYYGLPVQICSDSAYLVNCANDRWYMNWLNNGWKNSKGQPVVNQDLWEQLIPFFYNLNISFVKVQGHSGNAYNELADALATQVDLTKEKIYAIISKKRKEKEKSDE